MAMFLCPPMLPTISGQQYRTGNIDLAAYERTTFLDVITNCHEDGIVEGISRVGYAIFVLYSYKTY